MTDITTVKIADTLVPQKDAGEAFVMSIDFALAADLADQDERVELVEFQRDGVIMSAAFEIDAGMGAATTLKLQKENAAGDAWVDLTGASTADTAEREEGTASVRFSTGEKLVALLEGGDQDTAVTLSVDALVCHTAVRNS